MNPAKDLRTVAEMTQAQAADLIGVSLRSWKNWEAAGAMPAKKAQAFRDAMLNLDAKTVVGPTQYQSAATQLRALGQKEQPHIYTADDPFGQARIEHLRFAMPDNGEDTDTHEEHEVMASDDVGQDEIAGLIADLNRSKSDRQVQV